MTTNERIVIQTLSPENDADLRDVYAFTFLPEPPPGMRHRTLDEVKAMADAGLYYFARREPAGDVVGSCYFADASDDAHELGGARVHEDYRQAGLFTRLATFALLHHHATTAAPPIRVIARVSTDNDDPRGLQEALGFRALGREGSVDVFEFDPNEVPRLARELAEDFSSFAGRDGQSTDVGYAIAWFTEDLLRTLV